MLESHVFQGVVDIYAAPPMKISWTFESVTADITTTNNNMKSDATNAIIPRVMGTRNSKYTGTRRMDVTSKILRILAATARRKGS